MATAADIERDAVQRTRSPGDGAIVPLHTWPGPTAEVLPAIVGRFADSAAWFVTVG